jgi:hypothetical protein
LSHPPSLKPGVKSSNHFSRLNQTFGSIAPVTKSQQKLQLCASGSARVKLDSSCADDVHSTTESIMKANTRASRCSKETVADATHQLSPEFINLAVISNL